MTRLTMAAVISFILISLMFAGISYAKIDSKTIVGIWLLEEGKGNEIKDSVNGLKGEFFGSPKWTKGKYGSGLEFHGKTDWIVIKDSDKFGFPAKTDFTLAVWFKTESPPDPDEAAFIDKGYPDTSESLPWYLLMYQSSKTAALYVRQVAGTRPWANGKTMIADGKWHHIAGVKEGTKARVYVDGVVDGTAECPEADYGVNPDPLYIMRHYDCGIIGDVDEFAILNTALTDKEIQELMQGAGTVLGVASAGKLTTTWAEMKSVR